MKYPKLYAGCMLTLLVASGAHALTTPEAGQNERIEWKILQNWSTTGQTLDMVHSLDGKFVYILNDNQQVQVFNAQGQLQGAIPVADGVSSIDIAPQGETLYLINNKDNSFSSVSVSFVVDIDTAGSPFDGPADAPVTIAVFSDFEWPYCGKILPLIEQVLEKNPQTVKVVFKNMPLGMHKMAKPAALAALAAHEQGKFWEYHDQLFAQKKITKESLTQIATVLELDMARFEKDMAGSKAKGQLQKDLRDAQKAGVTGTPTIFINGRKPKQRNLRGFQAIINDELRKKGVK